MFIPLLALILPLASLLRADSHDRSTRDILEDESWFPFSFDEGMAEHSPANLAGWTLEAPAGKHGFLKTSGRDLAFEDGTPARFWGTNILFNACFPTKENAEAMARRLAFFGFNAVRLHHMDFDFEPRGIFRDTNPDATYIQDKPSGVLSPDQLDRLDYLIHQLKEHGIYINLNLLVSRRFTKADDVVDADKLTKAAKPVSLFDPRLIELQKEYARDLLTHKNPYTGQRYVDDPAIAFVEITNENSLISSWKWDRLNGPIFRHAEGSLPDYYVKELDRRWNDWLKKRYSRPKFARGAWAASQESRKGKRGPATKKTPREAGEDRIKTRTIVIQDTPPSRFRFKRPLYQTRSHYPARKMRDIRDFYTSLETEYFEEMVRFLKEDLDVKIPITGIGGYAHLENVRTMSAADYLDRHVYWDHPLFPERAWDKQNFRIKDICILK